ncbi:MAG: T9SS type A sorting domain-containing protein, partial [Bacteroidales bacterium]|nr:T9SS type A sorting domain-containing protein [Bacteroidales bacterium]
TNLAGDENPGNNCKTKAVVNAEPSLCVDNLYTSGCSFGDGLTSWDLENITVANIPCAGTPPWYQNYMDQIHNLEAGNTYVLTVTAGYADTYFDVWIDFDGNLELNNANELVLNDGICAVAGTVYTFNITIPADAPGGTYVMRARTNWTAAVVGACDTYSYGNCVDFKANIGGGQPTDWLSAMPLSGSLGAGQSQIVTVTFNSTGLEVPSIHNGSLIFASNAAGSPHTVPATLVVGGEGPIIVLNPTSLTENHPTPPQQTTQVVNVSNPGTEALTFDIAIQRSSTAGPDVVVDPEYVAAKLAERRAADGIVLGAANGVPGGVSPNMTDDEIIRYDDGTNADAIGLTAGGTFHVSAYWPASTMGQYAGMKLDAVEIFVYDAPTSMTLNIYGAGTPTTPGALLHSQPIAAVAQTWVMTTLTTPVDITGADIWIGYEVTHTAGTFCAGVDPGPAVAGFGDMISLAGGTYESMSISYGLNYNWNIAGYLVAGGPQLTNDVGVQTIISPNSGVALGTESVVIKVKNFGTAAQSNIPWSVTWTGAGSGSLSGTIPGPLAGGADIDVTAGTANLAAFGTYNFEACTNLAGDENAANNCKTKAVVNAEPSLCVDNLYTSGCSFGDGLTSWDLENITVANIPCAGTPPWYQDYTNMLHILEAGNTYVLTVTAGYADTYFDVWIDFDGNLELNNANELVLNDGLCAIAGTVYTFNLTIPADAPNGEFVMRARTNWIDPVTGACDTYSYGNCVDFKAEVGGGTPGGWLTADPMMGTVPAGGSMNVNVHFNSTGVNPGTYNGALIFTSNAPTSPTNLPVTFIVGQPTGGLTVNPTAINASHYAAPQVTQHILNATNTGTTPIAWNLVIDRDGSIGFKYATEYVKGLPPVSHPSAFERAPGTAYGNETIHSDADYDLQFEFACGDASGEAGVETDGNYIYTTKWNGAGFFKYELDGTFLGAFQVGSVSAIRDLAYDGMYFYGGAAATTVYKMDFNTNTLIGQFTAPVAVRAIGYDEGADGFWANNWSTTLTLFDDAGAVLNTIATNGDESFYGLAYDPQGPFLWGYSQRVGTSQNILYKYNIATGAKIEEFDVFPLLSIPITGDIAGGLAFHPDLVTGYYSIVGIVQNKCIWGLEMGMTPAPVEWLTASPMSGTTGAGQTSQITVSLNSEGLEAGVTYTGAVIFNTNSPVTPTVTVPVSLYVSGVGVGEPITDESMLMYPNPASDVLNIEATGIKHVMILNNLGQVVYDRPADNDNVQINTSNFGTGVYVVRIKTADKSYTEKLIIQ